MISKFQFIDENNNRIDPNLTYDQSVFLFQGCTNSEYHNYINSSTKGVAWSCNGFEIKVIKRGIKIFGYPTSDMERVLIIYPMENDVYLAPSNAVIYKADGSIHMQLHAPEPISELSKARARNLTKTKSFNPPHRLYFEGVSWAMVENKVETVVRIGFDRDFWEERILNPETGEFGECLSSGMR